MRLCIFTFTIAYYIGYASVGTQLHANNLQEPSQDSLAIYIPSCMKLDLAASFLVPYVLYIAEQIMYILRDTVLRTACDESKTHYG